MRRVSIILVIHLHYRPLLVFPDRAAIGQLPLISLVGIVIQVDDGAEGIVFLVPRIRVSQIGLLVVDDGGTYSHSISSAFPESQLHALAGLLLVAGCRLLGLSVRVLQLRGSLRIMLDNARVIMASRIAALSRHC